MTFHNKNQNNQAMNEIDKENVPENVDLKNYEIKTYNKSVTKDDIKAFFPNAKDETILCQAINSPRHLKGRKWSKNIIIFCLHW